MAARVVARQLWLRRVTEERAVRIGGVVTLTGLALVSEAGRSPAGDASGASVRQAFADVADVVGRAGASETRRTLPSVDGSGRRMVPSADTIGAAPVRRQGRPRLGPQHRGRVPLRFPVRGAVSSPFGTRTRWRDGSVLDQGVDLAVPVGTLVVATVRSRVLSVGRRGGYGLAVEVGHWSSGSLFTSTLYAHLSSLPAGLRTGLGVRRGAVIGFSGGVGAEAGISTGPHVHYEVRRGGVAVGPRSVDLTAWPRGSAPNRAPARQVSREHRSRVDVRSRQRLAQRGIP